MYLAASHESEEVLSSSSKVIAFFLRFRTALGGLSMALSLSLSATGEQDSRDVGPRA